MVMFNIIMYVMVARGVGFPITCALFRPCVHPALLLGRVLISPAPCRQESTNIFSQAGMMDHSFHCVCTLIHTWYLRTCYRAFLLFPRGECNSHQRHLAMLPKEVPSCTWCFVKFRSEQNSRFSTPAKKVVMRIAREQPSIARTNFSLHRPTLNERRRKYSRPKTDETTEGRTCLRSRTAKRTAAQ